MKGAAETIFALSSGAGRAGVAVVRISGPRALAAAAAMAGSPLPPPRVGALRRIVDPASGERLDQGLVLVFPDAASFTGEPSAELQLHGSRAVLDGVVRALAAMPGLRRALPGEFTRRAFENGKLDLTQVEALGDLIAADTSAQRRQALRGLDGRLGRLVAGWRGELLQARALLAAEIDFADEGDVGDGAASQIDSLVQRISREMEEVLASASSGRIVAEGFRVAIVGRPNSGKSSLLNALAGTDAAIVTEHAGTTRDVIEVRLDWAGLPVVLIDTAGLRATDDPVEAIGVARAMERAQAADLILHLDEDARWEPLPADAEGERSIRIRSKSDLGGFDIARSPLAVSARDVRSLEVLKATVLDRLQELAVFQDSALIVRERQAEALRAARAACGRLVAVPAFAPELRDHELQSVETALDALVGRISVEEVLGAVFSRFCIGK